MKIILASHNPDKVKEFAEILQTDDIVFEPLDALGDHREIAETGKSYRENAELKARAAYDYFRRPVLADDSGLSVDVLDGFPGIYSARFAGRKTTYPDKISRLWELLAEYPQEEWQASFICSLCYLNAAGQSFFYEGQVRGLIIPELRGKNGFGYDPVFYLPELGLTTAELSPSVKHRYSHRGRALRAWYRDWQAGNFI